MGIRKHMKKIEIAENTRRRRFTSDKNKLGIWKRDRERKGRNLDRENGGLERENSKESRVSTFDSILDFGHMMTMMTSAFLFLPLIIP